MGLKILVVVIPKEGMTGLVPVNFFWNDKYKDFVTSLLEIFFTDLILLLY